MDNDTKLKKQFTVYLSDWDNDNQYVHFVEAFDPNDAAEIAENLVSAESSSDVEARFIVNGFHKNLLNNITDVPPLDNTPDEYLVTWDIDVTANNPIGAAKEAHGLVRGRDTTACVYKVKSSDGSVTNVDLLDLH